MPLANSTWNRALDALIIWTYRPGIERLITACRLVLVAFLLDAVIAGGVLLVLYLAVTALRGLMV